MLEYDLEDAESLLSKNLKAASESQVQVDKDLDFLRDQYTTTEVSILFMNGHQCCSRVTTLRGQDRVRVTTLGFNVVFRVKVYTL